LEKGPTLGVASHPEVILDWRKQANALIEQEPGVSSWTITMVEALYCIALFLAVPGCQ
jgi:hypothetical protein